MPYLRCALLYLSILLAGFLPAKDYALFFAVNEYGEMLNLKNPIRNVTEIATVLKFETSTTNYSYHLQPVPSPREGQEERLPTTTPCAHY